MELPTSHRVPITWLRENASAAIRWRTVQDILPPGGATEADQQALLGELMIAKPVAQILKKQKASGLWGDNILGVVPAKAQGIKEVGTVARYRQLQELGIPGDDRSIRQTDRVFYRLLSRDEDPELAFEYRKAVKGDPALSTWARGLMREAAAAGLAHSKNVDDPRVRGAAHRIATDISQFLRSELAEKPFIRKGSRTLLHPDAHPPSLFSVAMVAYMPNLQRERAGFVERLSAFLSQPASKRPFVVQPGKKAIKPLFHFLGDPIQADSAGRPKDLPLALHWMELLARMGTLRTSPTASRCLARLLADCDERGVWSPKNLRSLPKSPSHLADFAFPLEFDLKSPVGKQTDVTFRLAHIAKLSGWALEYA